ncbi:ATP-binding cassette domain-containing protein [Dyadobacter fanqingshengii]|uniref:ATP-binding cassette domain-containing protein n=1 Tax=Dyadobacter fanqingshengii TaxID=2906443 RepID=A0A9X1T731_9BACT|nr:ATP-binding cassette domain-containing protein [Dyadobacter fanqingshengii]MCF0038705.1 ATP-binding cassette domain-containing protein [Dyadobacter fanqingshengii]USJ34463.1 ATP-binding cassette domain-containing protein [Dyadobacter fanqingshengii]
MSIQVTNLTKLYGTQRAIDGISFSLKKGEIVGFLGPNGAGKSTTMKILTGYLKASEGTAKVSDYDVAEEPMPARRTIGYLPEHNPLYLDMYVSEFLLFSGKLYGMKSAELRTRVYEVIALCGLEAEKRKKIGQLSKGYRQRVGLAQSFLHNPSVLILDEPTTGLDPNQIQEIRDVIRNAGKDKTVLFSTHIMQEVEALCDRVIIINKGKVVSDSSLDELRKTGDSLEEIFRSLTK